MKISSSPLLADFPELYAKMLPPIFSHPIPSESFATCKACAMCEGPPESAYRPDRKCCTFHPALPNYLVGAILKSEGGGSDRISRAIARRMGVSPVGVYPSRLFSVLYERGRLDGFGRSEALLCPYFETDSGHCSIWKFREAVCSTYFCKHLAGPKGEAFWQAVRDYMLQIQRSLTIYAMKTLAVQNIMDLVGEFMSERYRNGPMKVNDLDQTSTEAQYCAHWQEWRGREREYFIACYEAVAGLSAEQFTAICGVEQGIRANGVEELRSKMTALPALLARTAAVLKRSADDLEYVIPVAYARRSIRVKIGIVDGFDGTTETVLLIQRLRLAGYAVNQNLVLLLYTAGVLTVGAGSPSPVN